MQLDFTEHRKLLCNTLIRITDELLFWADEMELGRLPAHDGAAALRLAACLLSLQRELT